MAVWDVDVMLNATELVKGSIPHTVFSVSMQPLKHADIAANKHRLVHDFLPCGTSFCISVKVEEVIVGVQLCNSDVDDFPARHCAYQEVS